MSEWKNGEIGRGQILYIISVPWLEFGFYSKCHCSHLKVSRKGVM